MEIRHASQHAWLTVRHASERVGMDRRHAMELIAQERRHAREGRRWLPYGQETARPLGQFKTMKYMPDFPDRFGSLEEARRFCDGFFLAYNHEHRHSGIGMHTPASVHFGTAEQSGAQRQLTLDRAHTAHPGRFAHRPRPPQLPEVAWINQPTEQPQPVL
jgi:transposase InsO family protein